MHPAHETEDELYVLPQSEISSSTPAHTCSSPTGSSPTQQEPELLAPTVDISRDPALVPSTSRKRRRLEADESLPAFASETVLYSPPQSPRQPVRREPLTVKPPAFHSDWNLLQPPAKQRKPNSGSRPGSGAKSLADVGFPIKRDERGRPKGAVQSGSKRRLKF